MKTLFFLLMAMHFPVQSFAGANSSGGGPAMVCPSATDPVASAQMLDLFEGSIRYKTPAVLSGDSVHFEREIAYLFAHSNFLPPGVGMQVPLDVGSDYAPVIQEGCHLEAVGYYDISGELEISQTVLNKMDNTDQAAFYTHEALYKMDRLFGFATNSEETRQFNALLFSANANPLLPAQFMNFTWNLLQMPDRQFAGPTNSALPILEVNSVPQSIVLKIHNPKANAFYYYVDCLDFEDQRLKEWRSIPAGVSDLETSLDLSGANCQAYAIDISREASSPDLKGISANLIVDGNSLWSGLPQELMSDDQIAATLPIYVQE
jgi:hypothetical protein